MRIAVVTTADEEIRNYLTNIARGRKTAIRSTVRDLTQELVALVRERAPRKTGRLARSIQAKITATDTGVESVISSSVPYAGIQNVGGRTPPHEILPVNASVLRFSVIRGFNPVGNNRLGIVFARQVNHPGANIRGTGYATSALNDMRGRIVTEISRAAWGLR